MTEKRYSDKKTERYNALAAFDDDFRKNGVTFIAGVDEVGRGPLAGPVTAACVVLPAESGLVGADDSKKLTDRMRRRMSKDILEKALAFGFGERDAVCIDEVNILEAVKMAMKDAILEADAMLFERTGERIQLVLIDAVRPEGIDIPCLPVIKGDGKSLSIASASIIAKVRRDDYMISADGIYPGYGFANNKGYGTKAHYEALLRKGPSPLHRTSFLGSYYDMKKREETSDM